MAGLNAAQQEAVEVLAGPLLVLAGAGTGKTRVVTHRIARLIRHGTAPERILAVTFTNKAAGEMAERLAHLLGSGGRFPRGKPRPVIGTFHAQCVRLLRRHAERVGFPRNFVICDRSDQESLARQVLRDLRIPGESMRPGDMLYHISQWKNSGIRPATAILEARSDKEHLAASGYRRYQTALQQRGSMDFDDLLLVTEDLFAQHPEAREQEAAAFDQILVDEYQDTNGCQYRIIRALAQSHRNLCVVGDDDQSIYGWRGADVTHILNFPRDWPDARVVRLEENYRSTGAILEMANRLIAYNRHRHDKVLRPVRPAGMRPRILQWKNDAEEAKETVAEIRRILERGQTQPRDIAILFRTNEQPRLFETELRKARVPYVMLGSQSFFDRKEVRDLVAFLKWIDQPDDEVSLLRIINTPPRGLGSKTVADAVANAVQRGEPLWRVLADPSYQTQLPEAARRGVANLQHLRNEVLQAARSEGLPEAGRTLVRVSHYLDELGRLYDDPQERDARAGSVQEFVNAMAAHAEREESPSLSGFLAEIALAGRELGSEEDRLRSKNAVWLLTLHAAKGLEFPVVYMVGMEDGILPHQRSSDESLQGVDEERRLCYVGVTRAQENLTLSLALERMKWGKPRPTTPSRFLYELTGQAERASDSPQKMKQRGVRARRG
jgi:DNA helicase-2/ATP-dependent DNA helicase PcrA